MNAPTKPFPLGLTLLIVLALPLSSALVARPVSAASIVVNSNADVFSDDGQCTLREAIHNANNGSQLFSSAGECASGSDGADTITFADNFTITLDGSQLLILSDITISGTGATQTIIQASGCNPVTLEPSGCVPADYGVLEVKDSGNLTLEGVTVRHGNRYSGGGIFNDGTLIVMDSALSANFSDAMGSAILNHFSGTVTIMNSTLTNNFAESNGGAIYNVPSSITTIENSTISHNVAKIDGGAIYNSTFGSVTIKDSILSNNLAEGDGGGIYNSGHLTVTDSTLSGNLADDRLGGSTGGGILNTGVSIIENSTISTNTSVDGGGGISNSGDLTVTSSTLSENTASAAGGGVWNVGDLTISNSTFSGNRAAAGGGAYNEGEITIRNSTFYGNVAQQEGGGLYNDTTGTLNFINTIIAYSTQYDCANYGAFYIGNTHNLVMDGSCGALLKSDPFLGPLENNGGPTLTHALLLNSPAIDAGSATHCPDYDQRGISRPQGAACDIGAFEFVPPLVVTNNNNDGEGSLRKAIADISPSGTITFTPSLSGQSITLSSTLVIDKNLTIDGSNLPVPITISGANAVRVFLVEHSVEHATLNSLRIIHGNRLSGGGIYNQGELTIINSTLSRNTAEEDGGGIYNQGELTILNCTIVNNNAQEGGGGIFNAGYGYLWIEDSTLSKNSTEGDGGGIINMGYLQVINSTFSENSAQFGGAILNHELSQHLFVENSTFSANEAEANGGGIHNLGNLFIGNSTLYGNIASYGGGIVNWSEFWFINTIIASSKDGDCVNIGAIHVESTQNLVQDGSCQVDDLSNISGDPMLGPLANNGGPTLTHALLPWSPAIDAVYEDYCLPTDQRGISRPLDGNGDGVRVCDIGAFEFNPATDGVIFIYLPLIIK